MSFIFGRRNRSSERSRHCVKKDSSVKRPTSFPTRLVPFIETRYLRTIMSEGDLPLFSSKGVRFVERVITNTYDQYRSSRGTSSPNSSLTDSPTPLGVCGPLTVFSFIVPSQSKKLSYKEQKQQLKSAIAESPHFQDGLLLDTREKGVLFPVIHLSESSEFLSNRFQNCAFEESSIGKDFILHQGLYQEVRTIVPETELPRVAPIPQAQRNIGYILLGFKSLDKNFSQVMLDTWKDWTGARYIYMYLPDDLGLRRISFYHRQLPDDLNLFMYLVVVECHGVTNRDQQIRLLDFAQRMRLERMSGYISVYAGEKSEGLKSPSPPYDIPSLPASDFEPQSKRSDIAGSLFANGFIPRNTRV